MFTPGPFDSAAAPLGVRQPYALHVGDLHVRRNLSTALAAVIAVRGRLAAAEPPPLRLPVLVCAGVDRGTGGPLGSHAGGGLPPHSLAPARPVNRGAGSDPLPG